MFFVACIVAAMIVGAIKGWHEEKFIEENPEYGVEPSNSLFTFLFLDKVK